MRFRNPARGHLAAKGDNEATGRSQRVRKPTPKVVAAAEAAAAKSSPAKAKKAATPQNEATPPLKEPVTASEAPEEEVKPLF